MNKNHSDNKGTLSMSGSQDTSSEPTQDDTKGGGHEHNRGHQQSEDSDRNKPDTLEIDAVSFDKQKRLDSSWYEAKFPNHKFMWILDTGGEVDKYLRAGAEIQQDLSNEQHNTDTHGYKAKNRKGYVSVIGGTDHGVPVEQILLKMPKELYEKIITNPKKQRNLDIREAMGRGNASSEDRDGSDLQTYAANTPTGGVGFEQIAGQGGFNKLVNK